MDLAFLHRANLLGVLAALAIGLLLLALKPPDRASIRNTLVLLGVFALVEGVARVLEGGSAAQAVRAMSGAAAFGIGAVIIRLASALGFRTLLPALRVELPRIVEDLATTALAAGWLLFWLHLAGLDPASLITTSAVITAVLAFSMQDTLGNVLGGVVLQLDSSLRIGDWVKIDDVSGQVVDVRWRHTAIETRNRETVVIPNGWLVKNRFTVIGSRNDRTPKWRRWIWLNIEVAAPPSRVVQVLEDSVNLAEIPSVLRDPAPSAVLLDVNSSFARYALRYWMNNPRADDPTDSQVRMHALAALARNHIRLGVNQEERVIIEHSDERATALETAEVARRRKAVDGIELFATLTDDERDTIAQRLISAPFLKGDTITRQGANAHWLYLIASGEAEVWSESNGARTHIATLHAGEVFGEMGMMTGEPRRATVIAKTDVECLRLDKGAFESILRARPDLAGEISGVIVKRRSELDSRLDAASARAVAPQQAALLERIRGFFGLEG
jgi:small-conductance mechanosensitive channel/CRP-like cAMP-binding protein